MEYIVDKTDKVKKVTDEEKESIAKAISERFTQYDTARSTNLEKARKVINEVYFKTKANTKESTSIEENWKSDVKMCKMYMFHQILKAFIWKNVYANPNSMFDCSGESIEADSNSNKQKTMLVDILDKAGFAKVCDDVIENALIYGDLISFTTWKKRTEEYRRPIDFFQHLFKGDMNKLPKILEAVKAGKKFWVDEKIIYDNPYVYAVDPENFVFDASQFENNFDNCPKIYRTWKTAYDIVNNKDFELSKEAKEDIESMAKQDNQSDYANQSPDQHKNKTSNGSTIEVLEHWGDFTLPCGKTLRNWYAVVVAGKYLVRFEKNPLIMNPFSYGAIITDPETKRGISPLFSVYELALTQEDLLRKTANIQSLNENPPMLSPEGFFEKEGDCIRLYPGKIIEYDPNMHQRTPEAFTVDSKIFMDDIAYLDNLMSEISGIFPNMAGASENDRTTATEISTKVEGQLTRLKMILDIINQDYVLEVVKKVAKLCANFKFGKEHIFINKDNNPEDVEITDEIRQADYRYTYADRSATSERFNYADMLITAVERFAKFLPLNASEIFVWYMEQKGVENPERFIDGGNSIPPEVQQVLMQDPKLGVIIQDLMQRAQMEKQENGNPKPVAGGFDNNAIHEQKEMEKAIDG